jgi:hypothetical protein
MNDEQPVPVVQIAEEDIIQELPPAAKKKPGPKPKTPPPPAAPVSVPGYEKTPRPDPVVTNRQEFAEVLEDGRRHQEALEKATGVTTAAANYVSILFTPAQIHFMKALLLPQKAPIADEILVKFDSAL